MAAVTLSLPVVTRSSRAIARLNPMTSTSRRPDSGRPTLFEFAGGEPAFLAYSRECGDHSGLLYMHSATGDLGDLPGRFVDCFAAAADDAGLPADPEFRAALRAYMEWAVAQVVTYSPHDAAVPGDLPMPHWSWDGLVADPPG